MQTDGFTPSTGQKYASARDCVRKVWRTEGIAAFTRGLGPTLIRLVQTLVHPDQLVDIGNAVRHSPMERPSLALSWQAGFFIRSPWLECIFLLEW